MEKANLYSANLLFKHPFAASLSLLQSRHILFIYPDTVAQFTSNEWN